MEIMLRCGFVCQYRYDSLDGSFWGAPSVFVAYVFVACLLHKFVFHHRGDSPNNLRISQEKGVAPILSLTGFLYEPSRVIRTQKASHCDKEVKYEETT